MAQNQAQSLVGRQVGPYKIHSLLGVGGMGEVYLAQDPRLDRTIALKILPMELASDPDRMRRFIREARAASSLKHPNIATIYEIGKSDEFHFIAMEYVEGQTLANKISGRPLPIAEIVDIGIQVADALDEAHSKGITHRDIKPANLMLTPRGQVKVLDFGLSKVTRPEGQAMASDVSTVSKTETGVVMGTVQYMSPEQVLGHEVDPHTDIFSLGVVLYETATGRLPFSGSNVSETTDRILHGQPDAIARFNYNTPPELERIIRKLLEKDRALRYQNAADLRTDLKRLKRDIDSARGHENAAQGVPVAGHSTSAATTGLSSSLRSSTRWRKILIASGVLAALAIGLGIGWYASHRPKLEVELKQRQLTTNAFETPVNSAKISPDGKYLAYSDDTGVFLRVIDTGERNVLAIPAGARIADLNWFPDGSKLLASGFVGEEMTSKVWILSVFGGPPRLFQDDSDMAAVSPDGSQIALIRGDQKSIWLMKANGENSHSILTAPVEDYFSEVMWFPDGQGLGYHRFHAGTDSLVGSLESCDLEGRRIATVARVGSIVPGEDHQAIGGTCILPTGEFLYWMGPWKQNESNLWQISTDLKTGQPLGEPRRIMSSPGFNTYPPSSSVDGRRLVFLKSISQTEVYIAELQGSGGRMKTPRRLTWEDKNDAPLFWTPDSKAVFLMSNRNGNMDVFMQSLDERTARPVLTSREDEVDAMLTPDGQWILYFSSPTWHRESSATPVSLKRAPLSGGPSQVVHREKGFANVKCARLPSNLCVVDQRVEGQLIFSAFDPSRGKGRELTRTELFASPSSQYDWALSPDGSQIVGVIEGTNRLWILPVSGKRPKQEVVVKGWTRLTSPQWSADGQGWYVPSMSPPSLLYVDQRGQARVLWRDGEGGLPSPDGRYLASSAVTFNSNVWMIENFDQR